MKKALYFECNSGISGDMSVAALLNLGVNPEKLTETLKTLPLKGYRIEIKTVNKSGITACDFNVILDEAHENHDHDMEYLHGHSKHLVEHEHHHFHEHHNPHMHRSLSDVLTILKAGSLTPGAFTTAKKIFQILAEGESMAHGLPVEQVHFHEVGAVDSIVDIAAFSICLDMLKYNDIFVPKLYDGTGTIRCQHGIIPVPVPAVVNIVKQHQIPLSILPVQGELVTPTGAAIATAVATSYKLPTSFKILRTGIGAGKRNYNNSSGVLRIMEIEYTT